MSSDTAVTDVEWPAVPGYSDEPLHQPWRRIVALVELLLAAAAIWGGFACWDASLTEVVVNVDGTDLVSRHYAGNWLAAAIGLGAVAGLLGLDAVRQLLLAFGGRRRRRRASRKRNRPTGD